VSINQKRSKGQAGGSHYASSADLIISSHCDHLYVDGCTSLHRIIIPFSVEIISIGGFWGGTSMNEVLLHR
jgi:hypothetical protein